jgi:hypothetical protein
MGSANGYHVPAAAGQAGGVDLCLVDGADRIDASFERF